MAQKAYAYAKDNKAEIFIPEGATIRIKVKTNSKFTQKVTLTRKSGGEDLLFSGSGEGNTNIGDATITVEKNELFTAIFEYSNNEGAFNPSKLNSGGPYDIGNYNLLVIVAENGDDSDYNDSVLEFNWYTPKG